MPNSALLTTLKSQSILLKTTPDSMELENTFTSQLEKSHNADAGWFRAKYTIEERIDIYEEIIRSGNRYAFEWLLLKARKDEKLRFKFRYTAGADYNYEELTAKRIGDGFNFLTTNCAELMFSHADAGQSGQTLPNAGKQDRRRFRKIIDLVDRLVDPRDVAPFMLIFSKIAAANNNLYCFEKFNPDYQFIESWFFTALMAAAKADLTTLLDHWLTLGRERSFTATASLTAEDIQCIFSTPLKAHIGALINHLDDASKALLLNAHVRQIPQSAAAFEKFLNKLQLNPTLDHPALTEAFQHIAYCLTLDHVKCFMKQFGVRYATITANSLPESKEHDTYAGLDKARQRPDHRAIQCFLHAVEFLNQNSHPYDKDESFLATLRTFTAEDLTDLMAVVENREAYDAHYGYLVESLQADNSSSSQPMMLETNATPPEKSSHASASTRPTSDTLVTRGPFGLFANPGRLSQNEEIQKMCQLIIMTTNPSQPLPHALEMRQYAFEQLVKLTGEETTLTLHTDPSAGKDVIRTRSMTRS